MQLACSIDNKLLQPIADLDLTWVKRKLMHPEPEGKGWTPEQADEAELWYKRFLMLHLKHPGRRIVPTRFIDDVWHGHVLDTRKYAGDCQTLLGYFLHHFPYAGMRDEEDAARLRAAFEETLELFVEEFGDSPIGLPQEWWTLS